MPKKIDKAAKEREIAKKRHDGQTMYVHFGLNWIFSDPEHCEDDEIREILIKVKIKVL